MTTKPSLSSFMRACSVRPSGWLVARRDCLPASQFLVSGGEEREGRDGKGGGRAGQDQKGRHSNGLGWALLGRGTAAGFLNDLQAQFASRPPRCLVQSQRFVAKHQISFKKRVNRRVGESREPEGGRRTDAGRHAMQCVRWGKGNKMAVLSSPTTRWRG